MKVNPSQFSDNELPEYGKAQKTPKEIVIPLSGSDEPQNVTKKFEINFDKDGYPIPDGERLRYIPGDTVTFLGFVVSEKKPEYVYRADGKEFIADIKEKFNLKEGAIRKCNPAIRDDGYQPPKGTEIYFMKEDICIGM